MQEGLSTITFNMMAKRCYIYYHLPFKFNTPTSPISHLTHRNCLQHASFTHHKHDIRRRRRRNSTARKLYLIDMHLLLARKVRTTDRKAIASVPRELVRPAARAGSRRQRSRVEVEPDRPQGGQARAYNSQGEFDVGPEENGRRVVDHVVGVVEVVFCDGVGGYDACDAYGADAGRLVCVGGWRLWGTYAAPSMNMPMTASFFRMSSLMLRTMGMGSMRMIMSARISVNCGVVSTLFESVNWRLVRGFRNTDQK